MDLTPLIDRGIAGYLSDGLPELIFRFISPGASGELYRSNANLNPNQWRRQAGLEGSVPQNVA